MRDEGLRIISEAFKRKKTFKTLEYLNISDNEITEEGCEHIRTLLLHSHITTLIMNRNPNIGDQGVLKFYKALLLSNSALQKLDISECNLGHRGVSYLFEALKLNNNL